MKLPNKFTFYGNSISKTYTASLKSNNSYHITWENCDKGVDYVQSYIEQAFACGAWTMISNLDHVQLQKFDRVVLNDDTNRVYIFQSEEEQGIVLIDVVASSSCAMARSLFEEMLFTCHAAPKAVIDVLDTNVNGVLKYESASAKALNILLSSRTKLVSKLTDLQKELIDIDESIREITK